MDASQVSCGYSQVGSTDIWYLYTAGTTGLATFAAQDCMVGENNELTLVAFSLYDTCDGSEIGGVCRGDLCGEGPVSFSIAEDATYLVRLAVYVDSVTFAPDIVLQNGTATFVVSEETIVTANDDCADAQPVTAGSITLDMTAAATGGTGYGCGSTTGTNDVWFDYLADTTGTAVIQLDGDEQVMMTVLDACEGAVKACDGPGYPNRVFIETVEGTSYRIRVAKAGSFSASTRSMTITEYLAPSNDTCGGATEIGTSITLDGSAHSLSWDNTGARNDANEPALCEPSEASIWYSYLPASDGVAVFSTEGADTNTVVAAYDGCGGNLLSCNSSVGINSSDRQGMVAVRATAGNRLYFRLALETNQNFASHYAQGQLSVRLVSPLANDECGGAIPVSAGITDYNNRNATTSTQAAAPCSLLGVKDLWYTYTASSGAGTVTLNTCSSAPGTKINIDPFLAVYSGSCGSPTLVACNDNDEEVHCGSYAASYVTFNAAANNTYFIRIGSSTHQSPGAGRLSVAFVATACPADFNTVNGVTVQDIFDFLTAWLAGSPSANFNGVNGVTVQDIFDFLTAWLAGC